ncbi:MULTISPECIES: excisionase [Clostridium]|jgi:excisionase family DNA binding protein|uniref:excisionase n=1 Tax=Clostridium TaxID=1485 RepID=UPI000C08AD1F|nr:MULTISPECIES: excisionase [Clostridium]MDU4728248.1 excisionase [Clostridium sp.]DAU43717.1 MAG TPA: DNA binding domain protein [Caudoviricetes sp.]
MKEIVSLLKEILLSLNNKNSEKKTLNIVEASSYSGIGQDKIRELIDKTNTDFPFFKVGSKSRINKKLLDLWLEKISEEHRVI